MRALVHLHEHERCVVLPAAGGVLHLRELDQPANFEAFDVAAAKNVDRPLLESDGARGGIGDDAEVEFIQIRLAGLPVILVAHEMDVGAALPFLQLERTGADRRLVGGIGAVSVPS